MASHDGLNRVVVPIHEHTIEAELAERPAEDDVVRLAAAICR